MLFFDYFDTGAIEEYHQYGAFIFPQFLSEYYDGADWIRDSWVLASGHEDPFSALKAQFESEGLDPNSIFAEFAATNAYWDYAHQDWYTYYLDYYASYFNGSDHRVVEQLNPNGTGGWIESNPEHPIEYAGYHHIRLEDSAHSILYLSFDGDDIGAQGSEAQWSVTVIRKMGDALSYDWLGTNSSLDSIPISALDVTDEMTLSISLLADRYIDGEDFEYRYRLVPAGDETDPESPSAKQCGCHAVQEDPWAMLPGFIFLIGLTRVRRR